MVPVVERLLGVAAGAVDGAVLNAVSRARRLAMPPSASIPGVSFLPTASTPNARIKKTTEASDEDYFAPPALPPLTLRTVRPWSSGGVVADASWASQVVPESLPFSAANQTIHARLFLGARPRPTVVLLHGFNAGQWFVEESLWPLATFDRLGVDAAIVQLPFHGQRSGKSFGPPPWPSGHAEATRQGFRQAVSDVRALVAWLRSRGAPQVGLMGISLGAYTASLLATLDDNFAFLAALTPLASLETLAESQPALFEPQVRSAEDRRAYGEATRIVSPLARPPRVAPNRALFLAAKGDRVTPTVHSEKLAAHFRSDVHSFAGSHLLPVGIGSAFRQVTAMWEQIGFLAAASPQARSPEAVLPRRGPEALATAV
jgi:pimeloyl-ACP methyl ester carboxylesterase